MKSVRAGFVLFLVVAAVAIALLLRFAPGDVAADRIAMICCFTVFAAVGALIASRRRDHAIGWIYVAGAYVAIVGALAGAIVAIDRATGSVTPAAWWLERTLGVVALLMLVPLPLMLFPSGSVPSRRWRPVLWAAIAGIGSVSLQPAFLAGPYDHPPAPSNPIGIEGANGLLGSANTLGLLVLGFAVLATIVSLFRRYRRSAGVEREQYRWLAWAGVWTIVLLFMSGPGTYSGMLGPTASRMLIPATPYFFALAISAIPIAITIAILRLGLWEIDRIISRTVSYAIVTAIILAIYGLVAVVLPSWIVGGPDTPDVAIAAGTLVAAGAIGPVRRRVQTRVDRRFNRARYDATQTVDAFSARLREHVDLDTLAVELESLVDRTMRPAHLFLWLTPR